MYNRKLRILIRLRRNKVKINKNRLICYAFLVSPFAFRSVFWSFLMFLSLQVICMIECFAVKSDICEGRVFVYVLRFLSKEKHDS